MSYLDNLKPAGEWEEEFVRKTFPLCMSVDEYAARQAHRILLGGFLLYSYSDPEVHAWIHRLGAIMLNADGVPSLHELRMRYLSQAERDAIKQEMDALDRSFDELDDEV